MTHIF